jgi:SpoVK/Ycf46/Vps4 family AAA+-type ATPase
VSQRLLGSFLSWLQERKGDVFVIATANDVQRLPPELVRKGRFDELFFVDLPDTETRGEILDIHLRNRKFDPATFDLDPLVQHTEGFSGSELEQVVVSALYTAFAAGEELADRHLREAAVSTRPLSVTMSDRIDALRHWAAERTVRAN